MTDTYSGASKVVCIYNEVISLMALLYTIPLILMPLHLLSILIWQLKCTCLHHVTIAVAISTECIATSCSYSQRYWQYYTVFGNSVL